MSAATFMIYLGDIKDSWFPTIKLINIFVVSILGFDSLTEILREGFYLHFRNPSNLFDFMGFAVFYFTRVCFSFFRMFHLLDDLYFTEYRSKRQQKHKSTKQKNKNIILVPLQMIVGFVLEIYLRLQNYIIKILICIPLVVKIIPVIFTAIYTFSLIGVELFNESKTDIHNSQYLIQKYTDFDSLMSLNAYSWADIFYDIADRFAERYGFVQVAAYFLSFYTINNIILLSLTEGLILEVFLVVDENIEVHNRIQTSRTVTSKNRLPTEGQIGKTPTRNINISQNTELQDLSSMLKPKNYHRFNTQNPFYAAKFTSNKDENTNKLTKELLLKEQIKEIQRLHPSKTIEIDSTKRLPELDSVSEEFSEIDTKLKALNFKAPVVNGSSFPSTDFFKNGIQNTEKATEENREVLFPLPSLNELINEKPAEQTQVSKRIITYFADDIRSEDSGELPTVLDFMQSKQPSKSNTGRKMARTVSVPSKNLTSVSKITDLALQYFQSKTSLYDPNGSLLGNNRAKAEFGTMFIQVDEFSRTAPEWDRYVSDLRPLRMLDLTDLAVNQLHIKSHNLIKKRKLISSSNSNQEFLFRKAFMKEVDQGEVQKIEDEHLKGMFETYYNHLQNNNIHEDKKKLITLADLLNRMVEQMLRIHSLNEIPSQIFCKLLYHIEETLNKKVMVGENLGKFLFKTTRNKWFTLGFNDGDSLEITTLKDGPWQFASEIYPLDGEIYCCKNVFDKDNIRNDSEYWMNQFKTEFFKLWVNTNGAAPDEGLFNNTAWDLYSIKFENTAITEMGSEIIKEFYQRHGKTLNSISSMTVERVLFVTFIKEPQKTPIISKVDNFFEGSQTDLKTQKIASAKRNDGKRKSSIKKTVAHVQTEATDAGPKNVEDEKIIPPFKEIIGTLYDFSRVIMPYKANLFRKLSYFYIAVKVDVEVMNPTNLIDLITLFYQQIRKNEAEKGDYQSP